MKLFLYTLFFFLFGTWVWASSKPLVVGSKFFTESYILSEMVVLLLEEESQQPVERKLGLGGTQVAFQALNDGKIHVYPEYTGTGYAAILKKQGESHPDRVYQIVDRSFREKWGIEWSRPIGFNNTYALAVRGNDKEFEGVRTLSQLSEKGVEDYIYASPYEFMERKDGQVEFAKKYNFNFTPSQVLAMEAGLMYSAIRDKKVDIIVSYSTDGRIKAYNLRLLEDDKMFFPPYHVSLVAKSEVLRKSPALRQVFKRVENLITEDEMVYMNDQVDRLKREPIDVARAFLEKKGLIEKGSYDVFSDKKRYFFKLLIEHLSLSFGALALSILVSLPVGVLLTRYQRLGKVVFPIINIIQTIPSLALLGFLIPIMGIGFVPGLFALFLYSLLPLIRNTYTGILGVHKDYIEVSKGIGLTNMQILLIIEIPLALPVILAGLRTAAVIVVGTTTLVALIGAGGFGDPIFRGISTVNSHLILLGAVPVALLSIIVDKSIEYSERWLVSDGLRIVSRRSL